MTDTARLKALLKQRHIRQQDLARVLGKNRASVSKKITNVEPWKPAEVMKVAEMLQMPMLEAWEIFVTERPLTEEEKGYLFPIPPKWRLTEEEINRITKTAFGIE